MAPAAPGTHQSQHRRVTRPRQQGLPAAFHVQHEVAAGQDDDRPRLPARAGGHLASRRAGPARAAPRRTGWPGHRRQHDRGVRRGTPRRLRRPGARRSPRAGLRPGIGLPPRIGRLRGRAALRGQRAHPVHRPRQRELRGPQALHEVAAAALPSIFHGPEHRVDGREPARHPLGGHRAAQQDPVPVQQGPGQRVQQARRVGVSGRRQRPAPGDRGRPRGPAGHGRPAQAAPAPSRAGPGAAVARMPRGWHRR